jgi:hypothetical protein
MNKPVKRVTEKARRSQIAMNMERMIERLPSEAVDGREDAARAERDSVSETDRNEAEQLRRLAEDAREARDQHTGAVEAMRQEQERLREIAEMARAASEDARVAAEATRQTVVDAVRATAESLNATLEQMKVVEEMRRTLRESGDVGKCDFN